MSSLPRMVRLVVTMASEAQVPPCLKKFTVRLDEMEPLQPPRDNTPNESILVWDGLEGQSLEEFVGRLEETHKFILAWYERKEIHGAKGRTYVFHNLVYIWSALEVASTVHQRFAPVRPKIREELEQLLAKCKFTLRKFWDNPYHDHDTGEKIPGARRWEVLVNNCQPALGQKRQLSFSHALAEAEAKVEALAS